MELLLILSAMLSAVTGAFTGPREHEPGGMARAEAASAAGYVAAAAVEEQAAVAAPASPDSSPAAVPPVAFRAVAAAPAPRLWADRPRE